MKLIDLAKVLRSKNAGPLYVTFDIMFSDKSKLNFIIESGIISKKTIAELYQVNIEEVLITVYDIVNSIKITIPRKYVSGDINDNDIYGCQLHIPLSNLLIPKNTIKQNNILEV